MIQGFRFLPLCLILCFAVLIFSCGSTDYRYQKKCVPGIALSFDDRTVGEWYAMRELLNKYQVHATFFVTQFDSLNEEELKQLRILQQDGHEIGSHGAQHLLSENYIKEFSLEKYISDEIVPSINSMEKVGIHPTSFAYPYGAKYWFTDRELLKYFHILRGVREIGSDELSEMDEIFYQSDGDRVIDAVGIDYGSGLTIEQLKKAFGRCRQKSEVVCLFGHAPAEAAKPYHFNIDFLEEMLILAQEMKLKSYRMSELVR